MLLSLPVQLLSWGMMSLSRRKWKSRSGKICISRRKWKRESNNSVVLRGNHKVAGTYCVKEKTWLVLTLRIYHLDEAGLLRNKEFEKIQPE